MKIKLQNIGADIVRFQIAGKPGFPPEQFEVAPGQTCEIHPGYKNLIDRRSKGKLVPVADVPKPAPKAEEKPEPKKKAKFDKKDKAVSKKKD